MTTQQLAINTVNPKHEATVDHVDFPEGIMKPTDVKHHDKFGSHAKTDPKEIALVKKLDMYLMVSLLTKCTAATMLTAI
jgi:hypothetical protein